MLGRPDALAAASEAVLIAESLASDVAHRGTRATVGRMAVESNSITTIPGRVTFSLDIRDIYADRQRRAAAEIVSRVVASCRRRDVQLEVELIADTSPVVLPLWVRTALVHGAQDLALAYRVIQSGASHDAPRAPALTDQLIGCRSYLCGVEVGLPSLCFSLWRTGVGRSPNCP